MKTRKLWLIYILLLIPMFFSGLNFLYKDEPIIAKIYYEDGKTIQSKEIFDHFEYLDYLREPNIATLFVRFISVEYYLYKEIPATLIFEDETVKTTLIYGYPRYFSTALGGENHGFKNESENQVYLYNAKKEYTGNAKLIVQGVEVEVTLSNDTEFVSDVKKTYLDSISKEILSKNKVDALIFSSLDISTKAHGLFYPHISNNYNDVEYEGVVVSYDVNSGQNYRMVMDYFRYFESQGYIVQREIPKFEIVYRDIKTSYILAVCAILMFTVIPKVYKKVKKIL